MKAARVFLVAAFVLGAEAHDKEDCTCAAGPKCNPSDKKYTELCEDADAALTRGGRTGGEDLGETQKKCKDVEGDDGNSNICTWVPPPDAEGWKRSKQNAYAEDSCCDEFYATPSCELLSSTLGVALQGVGLHSRPMTCRSVLMTRRFYSACDAARDHWTGGFCLTPAQKTGRGAVG
jgi:hypothetical protein